MESKGKITITIDKSILTYDACTFSVMDPWFYAFLQESPQKNFKSQVKKDQGKLPIWNETFSFDINKERMLSIEVCHEKELLGTAEIYIEDIIKKSKYTGQHALLYEGKVRGTIYGTFVYVPSGNMPYNTIQPGQNVIPHNNNVVINPNIVNPNIVNPKINPNVVVPNVVIPNNNNFNYVNPNFINPNVVVPNIVNPVVPGNTSGYSYPSFDNNLVPGNSSYTHTDFQNNNYNNNTQYNNSGTTTSGNSNKTLNYFKNPLFFQGNSSSVWFFDINSKSWKNFNNFSNEYFPQYMRGAELPDGSFFLTGGDYSGQSLNSSSVFANGYTTKKENMLVGRKAHSTTYAKGSVYVFGGFSYNNAVVNFCEKYDLTSGGGWKQIAQMNVPRAYSTTLVYSDSFIFVIGGYMGQITNGFKETDVIEQYNIALDRFDIMNVRLVSPLYGCISTLISDVKILICGGWSDTTGYSRKVYTIDLSLGKIEYLPDLNQNTWSVLPAYYQNGSLNILFTGEEIDTMPVHVSYSLKI